MVLAGKSIVSHRSQKMTIVHLYNYQFWYTWGQDKTRQQQLRNPLSWDLVQVFPINAWFVLLELNLERPKLEENRNTNKSLYSCFVQVKLRQWPRERSFLIDLRWFPLWSLTNGQRRSIRYFVVEAISRLQLMFAPWMLFEVRLWSIKGWYLFIFIWIRETKH